MRPLTVALALLGSALALIPSLPAPLWTAPAALLGFDGQGQAVTAPLGNGRSLNWRRLEFRSPQNGKVAQTIALSPPDAGPIFAVTWTPDLRTVAWLSQPDPLQAPTLHLRRGQDTRTLGGPDQGLSGAQILALSPDGQQLYAGNFNGYVQVWDTVSGKRRRTLLQKGWSVERLLPSPDGARLLVGARGSGQSQLYDTRTWNAQPVGAFGKTPRSLAFTPDSGALYEADGHGPVRRYDLTAPGRVTALLRPTEPCDVSRWKNRCATGPVTLNLSRDGSTLMVGYFNGLAVVYDTSTGRERLRRQGSQPFFTAMSPDGRTLLTGGVMETPLRAFALP